MANVLMYTTENCGYCRMAKELLKSKGIAFDEIRVDLDPSKRDEMIARTQRRTVPQIFIDGVAIGGYTELAALAKAGKLNPT